MEEEKRPKPTAEEYRRFRELEEQMAPGEWNDEWVELYDARDWSPEIIKEDGKVGLKTALGEIILPVEYDNVRLLSSTIVEKGDRVVAQQGGKWGVVLADGEGTWLVEPEYDYIGYPNNITHVQREEKWGVLDIEKGEYLIPPECEMVFEYNGFMFVNGIGSYLKDGLHGIITAEGEMTPPLFEQVAPQPYGWVKVKYQGTWGFIDMDDRFTENEDDAAYCYDE